MIILFVLFYQLINFRLRLLMLRDCTRFCFRRPNLIYSGWFYTILLIVIFIHSICLICQHFVLGFVKKLNVLFLLRISLLLILLQLLHIIFMTLYFVEFLWIIRINHAIIIKISLFLNLLSFWRLKIDILLTVER